MLRFVGQPPKLGDDPALLQTAVFYLGMDAAHAVHAALVRHLGYAQREVKDL